MVSLWKIFAEDFFFLKFVYIEQLAKYQKKIPQSINVYINQSLIELSL